MECTYIPSPLLSPSFLSRLPTMQTHPAPIPTYFCPFPFPHLSTFTPSKLHSTIDLFNHKFLFTIYKCTSLSPTSSSSSLLIVSSALQAQMGSCQEWSPGPIIVGAGPSGLAVAALLAEEGIPSLLLERSHCIASLWQQKTYHRLKLHLPKQFCELPLMPFPSHYPKYPSRQQFVDYLESYAEKFSLRPRFGRLVVSGEFEGGLWRVRTADGAEYMSRWIVVATGENAEPVLPEINGLHLFRGRIMHSCVYKFGSDFEGEKVLVVGCGNSGMEVSLDLSKHQATPFMAVRDTVRTSVL